MASTDSALRSREGGDSLLYNPVVRGMLFQFLVFFGLAGFIWWIVSNTRDNLARAGRNVSFDFLNERAGFDVGQSLIPYSVRFDQLGCAGYRPAEHAADSGGWHHHGHHPWFSRRHRPALAQLAGPQGLHGLRRGLPQHSAAAGDLLLVPRRSGDPAIGPGSHHAAASVHPCRCKAWPIPKPVWGDGVLAGWPGVDPRDRYEHLRGALGEGPAGRDRSAMAGILDEPRPVDRPAVAWR